jgi:hypothetical protein
VAAEGRQLELLLQRDLVVVAGHRLVQAQSAGISHKGRWLSLDVLT